MRKIYIASPFFNPAQSEWVDQKEKSFDSEGVNYFSPRKLGISIPREMGPERVQAIKDIFRHDVEEIDKCTEMIANLNSYNGKIDIGTLWEVGYYVATKCTLEGLIIETDEPTLQNFVERLLDLEVHVSSLSEPSVIVDRSKIEDRDITTLRFYRLGCTHIEDLFNQTYGNYTFLIDDYPPKIFILIGFFYGRGLPFTTVSFKDYGSNVMIAASSKGHMKLPSFKDELNNQSIE